MQGSCLEKITPLHMQEAADQTKLYISHSPRLAG